MSESEQTFQNDLVEVAVAQYPRCQVRLTIQVRPNFAADLHKKALKNVAKEVSIPGFRKGKAPEALITSKFSKDVEREFQDLFVNESLYEALLLTKIQPVKGERASCKSAKVSKEGGSVVVEVEKLPNIPKINPAELHIPPRPESPINDEQVENQLELLRYRSADWKPANEAEIKLGDSITLHLEIAPEADGEQPQVYDNAQFYVVEKEMPPYIFEKIQGMKVGGEASGTHEQKQADGTAETFKYNFTVKEIHQAELPAVDEAFIAKFGVKSLEELKEGIKKQMEKNFKEEVDRTLREIIQQELLHHFSFDLPASFIKKEAENRLENALGQLKKAGTSGEELEKSKQELKKTTEVEAEKALKLYFLVHAIINEENITHDPSQLVNRYFNFVREHNLDLNRKEAKEFHDAIIENLRRQLVWDNALDWLIERANSSEPHQHSH